MHPLIHWIPKLTGLNVLVIGDVILDEYLIGRATRLSREAPVPVLEFEERRLIAGGAANPSANISALGSRAVQAGVIGADSAGESLQGVLRGRGIDTRGLVIDAERPTTVKTRVMAQMGLRFPQQVARLDTLSRASIPALTERLLVERIVQELPRANAVLFSDYRGGLLTPSLVDRVKSAAWEYGVMVTADAQGALDTYTGVALMKCNADEARQYAGHNLHTADDFAGSARDLCQRFRLSTGMVITRGGDGATLATPDGRVAHVSAPHVTDVYDTVGAGDTAIAVMTLALCAGASPADAVLLANYASGIVVRRVGNYAPTPAELIDALNGG